MSKATFTIAPASQEITLTREFDAPVEQVYRVSNDPSLIPRWWGPARLTSTVEKMEVRAGGSWRIVQRDDNGGEYAFHGVYHDASPAAVVRTFEFEGVPGHVAMETARLEDIGGGRTRLTVTSVFQSVEDRDGMAASGMESGATESMDRLAELVRLDSQGASRR